MAKFVLTDYYPDPSYFGGFSALFNKNTLALEDGATSTKATISDGFGYGFELTGTGLTYDSDGLSGGTVNKIVFFSEDGTMLTVTGSGYTATSLPTDNVYNLFTMLQQSNDTIQGSDGSESIFDGLDAGNDKVFANGGDDEVMGSAGKNTLDGGDGFDTLNYTSSQLDKKNAKSGVEIDIAKGTAINPWGGKDTFSNFEHYIGSHGKDTFKGSVAADIMEGYNGNDTYTGGKGSDIFIFHTGEGQDTITDFGKGGDVLQITNSYTNDPMPVPYSDFDQIDHLMTEKDGGVLLDFGGKNGSIFFKGAEKADLTTEHFTFVLDL